MVDTEQVRALKAASNAVLMHEVRSRIEHGNLLSAELGAIRKSRLGACLDDDCECPCHDGGDLDQRAVEEAVVRWRRGEVREALYQIEKAFGAELRGLADLTPEQLK